MQQANQVTACKQAKSTVRWDFISVTQANRAARVRPNLFGRGKIPN